MSHHSSYHLKRLQHDITSNLHLSSHNSYTNSFDSHTRFPNDEALHESIQHFTISNNHNNQNQFQSSKPGPQRAIRGGGRFRDRHLILPKRAINYDLAESFMDHSTNPLSSDLYQIKFKHSIKKWPNGRFKTYKEKLDKSDGNLIEIICTKTFPIVRKRKIMPDINTNEQQNLSITSSSINSFNPIVQEEKKKQINQQTNLYANLFGGGRIPRLSSTTQPKKSNPSTNPSSSSTSISLLDENPPTDHQS